MQLKPMKHKHRTSETIDTYMNLLKYSVVVCAVLIFTGQAPSRAASDKEPAPAERFSASLSGKTISQIDMNITGPSGNDTYHADMAKNLIVLKSGDMFSAERLQQSTDALTLCGHFASVHVNIDESKNAVALYFDLTVNRYIKDVQIKGEGPVFKKDILNAMTVYPGDTWNEAELRKQETYISGLFIKKGFPSPSVHVSSRLDPQDTFYVVHVAIEPGPFLTLKKLTLIGNHNFSGIRLKSRMKTWRASFFPGSSGRFVQDIFKADIDKLTRFYRANGFPDASVAYSLDIPEGQNTVSVLITIDEGCEYDIAFTGNSEFWDRTLKKDIVVYSTGNKNNMGIRKSVKNIKARYRNAGYSGIDIKVEETFPAEKETAGLKNVRFIIQEGPQTIVSSLTIKGNSRIATNKIKKQMLTRAESRLSKGIFVPETLMDDMNVIHTLYAGQGYYYAEIKDDIILGDDKKTAAITIEIEEGPLVEVSSVRFSGLTVMEESKALESLRLKPGGPFSNNMMKNDENTLSALISEKGRPHVRVNGTVAIHEDRFAQIVYQVDEGVRVAMGNVYVSGNLRTQEEVIHDEIDIAPGDPFSLSDMLKSQQNIRSMDIFRSVQFKTIGLKEQQDRVHLFIETEEKNPFYIELGAGYRSDQGAFGKATIGDRNLLGANKDGYMSWGVSEIGYRGDIGVKDPRLWGTHISSLLNVYTENREEFNQNFGIDIMGAGFGLNQKLPWHLSAGLNATFEKRKKYRLEPVAPSDESDASADENDYGSRRTAALSPVITYDTRDTYMRPRNGMLSTFDITASRGLNYDIDNFMKYQLGIRYYVSPADRLTVAMIARAGYIDPYSASGAVSEDQLFFLGGISTVRGFRENMLVFDENNDPVGGRSVFSGSVELRIAMTEDFNLTVFYDGGKLTDTYIKTGLDTYRSSAGLGLGYQTPAGPIGFYYGRKLDPKPDESVGCFHFSIGYTF